MNKLIALSFVFLIAFSFSMQSASAIFLGGEEWFGRPITRGSMQSQDMFGFDFGASRNTNSFSSSSSNDFLNEMVGGDFAYNDAQQSMSYGANGGNARSGNYQVGNGNQLTRKVVYTQNFDGRGKRGDYSVTHVLEEYGGEFANINFNNYDNYNGQQSQSARNVGAALNYNNQRNSGSSTQSQDAYQDSINGQFGQRATRGFSINLNRFF